MFQMQIYLGRRVKTHSWIILIGALYTFSFSICIKALFCLHFIDENTEDQGHLVLIQKEHANILWEGYLKYSWFLGVTKDMEVGLVQCTKSSIRSEKGKSWRRKRIIKKNSCISMDTNSAYILDGKSTFSVELCKRRHCVCVQRASLRKISGHCLHSKWPDWWRKWALFQID